MLAFAETYARDHPDDYEGIVNKYWLVVRACQASLEGLKATDAANSWGRKWQEAADAEFETRRSSTVTMLEAWRFQDAVQVWEEFPRNVRNPTIQPKIKAELARIEEARNAVPATLEREAQALLAKKPEELTEYDVKSLHALQERVESPPAGLTNEGKDKLVGLAGKIAEQLSAREQLQAAKAELQAAKAGEAFEKFWTQYEKLIREKKFDDAVALCRSSFASALSGGSEADAAGAKNSSSLPPEDETTKLLKIVAADCGTLKELFAKIEENLSGLKGKTVPIAGKPMTVTDVKGGKVYAGEGGAAAGWDTDMVDADVLLELGLAGPEDPKLKARARAVHAFYYRRLTDASKALKEAEGAGEDVSFYQSRMTPALVVTTTPAGATVEFKKMVNGQWLKVDEKKRSTPFRENVEKNAIYGLEISADGYLAVTKEVTIGQAGEFRVSARLKKAPLPSALSAYFEVPNESKDKYGNPVRKGFDRSTSLPLEIRHQRTGMHFVFVPPGEFMMGSPDDEKDRDATNEWPAHKVRLSRPFYVGKYEVTQADWRAMMAIDESRFLGDRNPVEQVRWDTIQEFINKMNAAFRSESQRDRHGDLPGARKEPTSTARADVGHWDWAFDLPTEAQWEYACRAGTKTRFHYGDDPGYETLGDYAWFDGNSEGRTHPVGEKKCNRWALYDMLGNVNEVCAGWYGSYSRAPETDPTGPKDGTSRVIHGGAYAAQARFCRSAFRSGAGQISYPTTGFRLALKLCP
jgi:formylglycine-generating enzyme required for sulfatase activity